MIFFSRNQVNENIAISMGARTIKAFIFESQGKKAPPRGIKKVITRIRPPYTGVHMVEMLHEIIFSLLKKNEHIPEKITIGIGSEIAELKWERWEVQLLNAKESFTKIHLQKYFHEFFDRFHDKNQSVFYYPVSLEANGYPVDAAILAHQNPSLIKELAIRTITVTFTDGIGALFGELQKMFGGITIELVPHVAAIAESISQTISVKDAFLVDVGDALTTLIFIQEGRLVQFASFPLGADNLTYRLMKKSGISFSEAEDLKRQYIQKIIPQKNQARISQIILEEVEEWKRKFITELEHFYHIGPIPQNIFLSGEGASIPEMRSSLVSSEFSKIFSYVESFNIQVLQGLTIYNGNSLQGMIQGSEDVKLASLAYYALNHIYFF